MRWSLAFVLVTIASTATAEDAQPTRARSPAMIYAGVTTTALGACTVAGSFVLLGFAHLVDGCGDGRTCTTDSSSGMVALSVLGVVVGGLAIAGGIPMIVFGARRVPVEQRTGVWLTPAGMLGSF
jgi:hypothetical protein